jgi:hypothetical protein
MLNLERAVLMMARVEIARINGHHDQTNWYQITVLDGTLPEGEDLIVDEKTGQVVGYGSCATGRCAAGWALHDDPDTHLRWTPVTANTLRAYDTKDGRSVPMAACDWLGIDWLYDGDGEYDERWNYSDDMPRLFDTDNNINDLYAFLAQWWEDEAMTEAEKEAALRVMTDRKVDELMRASVSAGPQ